MKSAAVAIYKTITPAPSTSLGKGGSVKRENRREIFPQEERPTSARLPRREKRMGNKEKTREAR